MRHVQEGWPSNKRKLLCMSQLENTWVRNTSSVFTTTYFLEKEINDLTNTQVECYDISLWYPLRYHKDVWKCSFFYLVARSPMWNWKDGANLKHLLYKWIQQVPTWKYWAHGAGLQQTFSSRNSTTTSISYTITHLMLRYAWYPEASIQLRPSWKWKSVQ